MDGFKGITGFLITKPFIVFLMILKPFYYYNDNRFVITGYRIRQAQIRTQIVFPQVLKIVFFILFWKQFLFYLYPAKRPFTQVIY